MIRSRWCIKKIFQVSTEYTLSVYTEQSVAEDVIVYIRLQDNMSIIYMMFRFDCYIKMIHGIQEAAMKLKMKIGIAFIDHTKLLIL